MINKGGVRRGFISNSLWKKVAQEISRYWFVPLPVRVLIHRIRGVQFSDPGSVYIGVGVRFDAANPQLLHIGKYVHIEEGAKILCHYISTTERRLYYKETVVDDGAYIGLCSIIKPGIRIGKGAYVEANSVVFNDVKSGDVVGGVPAVSIEN